jgi:hypothetical protein
MSKKFIFVNTDGFNQESAGAYEEADFVSVSTGATDAGKPIVLDAGGKIDASMIDDSDIDHGSIGGLSDDDHTQYLLTDGSRDVTGAMEYSSHPSFSIDTQIVDKKYVDDSIASNLQGLEWQDSVIDASLLTPPVSPSAGDRYLINGVGTGAWATHDGKIAEWSGSAWIFTVPTTGMFVSADDEVDFVYYYGGSSWVQKGFEQTTASLGLTKVGYDVRLANANTGAINVASGVISVNVDGLTVEKGSGTGNPLQVKADGINDTHIDFGTGTNQVNAADLPIIDTNNYFAATDVEAALAELYTSVSQPGVSYTVGTGGVAKGALCYVSANNTVLPLSTLSSANYGVGLAASAVSAGNPVQVLADDTVLAGVLSGATAGTRYYWNGTALQTSIPTGNGSHVWAVGVAKNATDLHVQVEFVKKNA